MKCYISLSGDSDDNTYYNTFEYITEKAGYRVTHVLFPNSIWDNDGEVMEEMASEGSWLNIHWVLFMNLAYC